MQKKIRKFNNNKKIKIKMKKLIIMNNNNRMKINKIIDLKIHI